MKIWIKYIIGILLGFFASWIIPFETRTSSETLAFLTELATRFGRYTILPVLFFGVSTAVFKLRNSKNLLRPTFHIVSITVVSAVILVAVGLISILFVKLPHIPISAGKMVVTEPIDIKQLILSLFPYSGFEALLDGMFLLPLFLLAGLAGAGCAVDPIASKPTTNLFDSLARISYNIMAFFVDMLAIGMIAISCTWFLDAQSIFKSGIYTSLIIMLSIDLIIITCIIYPLITFFYCKGSHPFKVLYASICPILVAFFSGDTNLTLPIALRHGHESLGIKRRINAVTYPIFSIFARGGTALVTSICFVLILTSYSKLSVSVSDIFWIAGTSFGLSFILGELPIGGTFTALITMCAMYGRGFETGYLLLKPATFIIGSFAAAIDCATAMFGSYITAYKMKMVENTDLHHFI